MKKRIVQFFQNWGFIVGTIFLVGVAWADNLRDMREIIEKQDSHHYQDSVIMVNQVGIKSAIDSLNIILKYEFRDIDRRQTRVEKRLKIDD